VANVSVALTGLRVTFYRGGISGVQRTSGPSITSSGRVILFPTIPTTGVDRSKPALRKVLYPTTAMRSILDVGAKLQVVPIWTVLPRTPTCGVYTTATAQTTTGAAYGGYLIGTNYTAGTLSGTVTAGGVPRAGYKVRLYYRPNGFFLDEVRTAADGTYTFSAFVNTYEIGNYTVVATDITDTYDAVVHDRLTAG